MRKSVKLFGKELASWGDELAIKPSVINKNPNTDIKVLPPQRVSQPNFNSSSGLTLGQEELNIIDPVVFLEFIPIIRKYIYSNQNLSQALNNIVELGNTGHTIRFDSTVPEQQANKMRAHLDRKEHQWFEITAGIDGFVNKMISQIMISGALSTEWVPNMQLNGIKTVLLVDPETIRWEYNKITNNYNPYQKLYGTQYTLDIRKDWIKLNPNTFKYHALNGDTDNPYGIPPYLPTLDSLETQKLMLDNIKFIVEQIGVMGFLQVTMEKPEQEGGESNDQYRARLTKFLSDARERVKLGYRDGISVGYTGDTEFDFKATSKNFDGVGKLFELNEVLFSSGLKQDPGMLGKNYGATESQITVVFSKLLAQLKNIQNLVKYNLEFGYGLELRLAGFKFNKINVTFNPSTAVDKLKEAQANEIKVRNLNALWNAGIISQSTYAHEMGYEEPDQEKPRVITNQPTGGVGQGDAVKPAQDRKKAKKVNEKVNKKKSKY